MNVKAVVFDLDDTLYNENDYVLSGFAAVAAEILTVYGIENSQKELCALYEEDNKFVFDRFADKYCLTDPNCDAARMIEIFREHKPDITLSDEVKQVLIGLRDKGYKLGIITDGRPSAQRAKIVSLGLELLVDKIIVTDELGGMQYRKPNRTAFDMMSKELCVEPDGIVYVGDNPAKDFAVKKYLPINTIMVRGNGLYKNESFADGIKPDHIVNAISELPAVIEKLTFDERYRSFAHSKLLELLKFVDNICREENIPYSLAGGTLLGAVRHNGFIPWDDDADVVMTRENFDKFRSVCDKYLDGSEFTMFNHDRVDGVAYKHAQDFDGIPVDGGYLCCDIFTLDNVPDDDRAFRKQVFGLKKLQGMMKRGKIDWKKYNLKGKILVLGTLVLGMFTSKKRMLKKYTELSVKYNNIVTKRKFISNDVYSMFDIPYDNEILTDTVYHDFETEKFPIFAHYDKMLTLMYGDYMTPPPVEQQKFMHLPRLESNGK